MQKGIPLTTTNIVSVLKKAGFTTKKDLNGFATKDDLKNFATKDDLKSGLSGLRKQINDDQFEARTEFYQKMTKPAIDKMGAELKIEIEKVDSKLDKNTERLSSEIAAIKDDLSGLTAEFSTHHHATSLKN